MRPMENHSVAKEFAEIIGVNQGGDILRPLWSGHTKDELITLRDAR